jgi:peroxiredoxin
MARIKGKGEGMFFGKYLKVLMIAWFIVGVFLTPATAVEQGKVYSNLSIPQIGRLDQVGAPYVVLEVMRTSCPPCQKEAAAMNKFYHLVQGSDLKGKVKFLAVAQSSSAEEVRKFKQAHAVPFQMLADPNSTVEKTLHIQGVPTVVVLKRDGQVLRVHVGGIDSPQEALAELHKLIK